MRISKQNITRIGSLLLLIMFLGMAISCTTPARVELQVRTELKGAAQLGITTITGRIEQGPDDSFEIVTAWDSKSRVSHRIIGDFAGFLRDKTGDIVTMDMVILKTYSTWKHDIVVVSVHAQPSLN